MITLPIILINFLPKQMEDENAREAVNPESPGKRLLTWGYVGR